MTRTLLLLAALAADPGAGDPAAPVDLASVLNEAQVVEAADTAAWAHLSFRRHTVRQDLGDNDEVLKAEEMVFRVTPKAGGFDEALVLLDGKTPEPQEVKKQRRLGRFAKHYRTLIRGDSEDSAEGGYSLGDLLHLSAYRYVGRETVASVPCYRLDFSPDDSKKTSGLAGRFANAMGGSLWLTVEGGHMARAVARTLRPVSIAFSLSKVHDLQVSLESAPVGGGVWLPRRIEVLTKARVLTFFISRRNLYTYSDFEAGSSH